MTKQEFIARVTHKQRQEISDKDFAKVQVVYMYHPAISATFGKDEIAAIYNAGGMMVINDMYKTAIKAMEMQQEIDRARAALDKAREAYTEFCRGLN